MTANQDLQRRLTNHYADEASQRAPDWVLQAALTAIDRTPQRRGLTALRRYADMPMFKLAAAAVAVIAVGAVALWQLAPPGGPGGPTIAPTQSVPPTASPAASSQSTPVPTAQAGTADSFVRPFSFVLPGVPAFDIASSTDRLFEARVPEWFEDEPSHIGGIIIQAVGGGLSDPCDRTSTVVPLGSDVDAIFTYLKTVPGVTITNETDTTVDGRPARQATLVAAPETDCPEIWAWQHASEPFISGAQLRVITVDVDAEPIVIAIFGEPENPDWPEMADEILASLRFQPVASPSG